MVAFHPLKELEPQFQFLNTIFLGRDLYSNCHSDCNSTVSFAERLKDCEKIALNI